MAGTTKRERVLTRNALLVEYAMKSSEFVRGGHRMLLSFIAITASSLPHARRRGLLRHPSRIRFPNRVKQPHSKMTAGSTILIRARATSGAGIGSHLRTR